MYHKFGVKNIPHGTAGHFSRQNWGTVTEQRDGARVIVSRSHKLLKMAKLLSDTQWTKIIDAAMFYVGSVKAGAEEEDLFYEPSSDFQLEDGDEDADMEDEQEGSWAE
jgi:hypothetical protein